MLRPGNLFSDYFLLLAIASPQFVILFSVYKKARPTKLLWQVIRRASLLSWSHGLKKNTHLIPHHFTKFSRYQIFKITKIWCLGKRRRLIFKQTNSIKCREISLFSNHKNHKFLVIESIVPPWRTVPSPRSRAPCSGAHWPFKTRWWCFEWCLWWVELVIESYCIWEIILIFCIALLLVNFLINPRIYRYNVHCVTLRNPLILVGRSFLFAAPPP